MSGRGGGREERTCAQREVATYSRGKGARATGRSCVDGDLLF
jgi:hypothetical protein